METGRIFKISCVSLALLALPVFAGSGNRFGVIAQRNPFGLRPMPPPPAAPPPAKPPEPARELKISGLVVFQNIRKVALYAIEKGKAPKPYMLNVGEQRDGIKVLSIDPKTETARVEHNGVVSVLDFKNHGMKPTLAAVPAPKVVRRPVPHMRFTPPIPSPGRGAVSYRRR